MALKVAIIGAGVSGLVAAKECLEEGLQPTVFEARESIGGQWYYENPDPITGNTFSSVYDGVVSNTSSLRSQFSDFPMDPARYPDYPTHKDYLTYIREYSDHFGLGKCTRLGTEVLNCDKQEDGCWRVTTRTTEELYDALIVCAGKENFPYTPDINGLEDFQGRVIHSHIYRKPDRYTNKRVAVVGIGASAVDIASEISTRAQSCHLITQRGAWVLPRYIRGKLVESLSTRLVGYTMPRYLLQSNYELIHRWVMGEIPKNLKPEHRILESNAVVAPDFLELVRSGHITAHRASVKKFTEKEMLLTNGETLEVDEVIFCTGYSVTMPMIAEDTYRGSKPNSVHLYRLINSPSHENLFFLGLVEFLGPIHPTVELQARWAVALLTKRIPRPSPEVMKIEIDQFSKRQNELFVNSRRHTIAVPALEYLETLAIDLDVKPNFNKLTRTYVLSKSPLKGLSIVNYYYNGLITAAPYRLFGHGKKPEMAEATILRMASNGKDLSESEQVLLAVEKAEWNTIGGV